MRINVNGIETIFPGQALSYEDAVALAQRKEKQLHTVTYHDPTTKRGGTLTPGQRVSVTEGMVFNVVTTDRA